MSLDLSYDIHVLGTHCKAREEQETEIIDVSAGVVRMADKSAAHQAGTQSALPKAA